MTADDKAPDAGQSVEGDITTTEGRDMSTVTHTLTHAQEDALIRAWARDYAASHPATPPPVPRELWPTWAVDVDVNEGGAREVHITFTGTTHGDTACLERYYNVVVLPHPDVDDHGTWECEGTKVWAEPLSDDLTPAAARALAAALTAAADEVEARTTPTETTAVDSTPTAADLSLFADPGPETKRDARGRAIFAPEYPNSPEHVAVIITRFLDGDGTVQRRGGARILRGAFITHLNAWRAAGNRQELSQRAVGEAMKRLHFRRTASQGKRYYEGLRDHADQ